MKPLIDKIAMLSEYRIKLKHLRGRHNQLDHAWNRGMGRGDSGGGSLAANQMGPVVSENFYRKRKVDLMNQKRRGEITSSEMQQTLNDLRGIVKPETQFMTLANRTTQPLVANPQPALRPERRADLPIKHIPINDPARRREAARQQHEEFLRRHRMMNRTAINQGLVSPSVMETTGYQPDPQSFSFDDTSTNLFENPTLITGVDFNGDATNLMDFMDAQYQTATDEIASYLDDMVSAGLVTEEEAQADFDEILSRHSLTMQAVFKKAAASFAMDIQGFVGGEVYATSDPEFESAMIMATQANQVMSNARAVLQGLAQKYFERAQTDDARAFFRDTLIDKLIDAPYRDWTNLQMKNLGMQSTTVSRLSRVNPSLTTDVIERSIEQSSGSGAPTSMAFDQMQGQDVAASFADKPATNTDNLTMSLPALTAMLHPTIQRQLKRLTNERIIYPSNEDPSEVIGEVATMPLSPRQRQAVDIFSGIVDAVHSDGGISNVGVFDDDEADAGGYYGVFTASHLAMGRMGLPDTGTPIVGLSTSDDVGSDLPLPVLKVAHTMAHEFGHHIDNTALPFGSSYWREPDPVSGRPYPMLTTAVGTAGGVPPNFADKAEMAPHILAIMQAYMAKVKPHHQKMLKAAKGNPDRIAELNAAFKYLDQPHEVFARLYAQWMFTKMHERLTAGLPVPGIADADRDKALASVEQVLRKGHGGIMQAGKTTYPTSEMQYDFRPGDEPFAELESLLATMGWRIK